MENGNCHFGSVSQQKMCDTYPMKRAKVKEDEKGLLALIQETTCGQMSNGAFIESLGGVR